jgi:RHH-type rel operon transcriptional repressor/antitoxin RelB
MATTVRLTPDMDSRLDTLAKATGRSKTFYLKEIVHRSLDDVEDYYLAESAQAKIGCQAEPMFDLDEVRKELGLD